MLTKYQQPLVIPEIGPSALWALTGAGNSGYTVVPTPSGQRAAGTKAQPAVHIMSAYDKVMLVDEYLLIQCEAVDATREDAHFGVEVLVEGNSVTLNSRRTFEYVDKRGVNQSFYGYVCKLKRPSVWLGPVAGGGSKICVYFKSIPMFPATQDPKIVGPFNFFPADNSRVLDVTLHKTGGRATYTSFSAYWTGAIAEYASTGRFMRAKIVDAGKNWGITKLSYDASLPAYVTIENGNDLDTGLPITNSVVGDLTALPADGYSSLTVDHLGFIGLKFDQGALLGLVSNPRASSRTLNAMFDGCEMYCGTYPASFTAGATPRTSTGSGVTTLIDGNQAGAWWTKLANTTSIALFLDCYMHDLPSFAALGATILRNPTINNISGSPIQEMAGGLYGGTVQYFGGVFSGLLNYGADYNPGMKIVYSGPDAWWGYTRTNNTGAPDDGASTNTRFRLWSGTTQATATIVAGYDFDISTSTIGAGKVGMSVSALATAINAVGAGVFTATDLTTSAFKLNALYLSVLYYAGTSNAYPAASPIIDGALPYPGVIGAGGSTLRVVVDIHADGYVHNSVSATLYRTNLTARDTKFFNYCGGAPISGSGSSNTYPYRDMVVVNCQWNDMGYRYVNRLAQLEVIGCEPGYLTGAHDHFGVVACSFIGGDANTACGIHFGLPTYKTQKDTLISRVVGTIGDMVSAGFTVRNCVSPGASVPVGAITSKPLGGPPGSIFDQHLMLTDMDTNNNTPKAATSYLTCASGKIAGALGYSGQLQRTPA